MDTSELAIFHGLEMSSEAWAYQRGDKHRLSKQLMTGA
ncbi:hypothetical protein PXO_05768 [Xanthomonas oryzae pv. oryzae PXO99A]|uniref:Transposase n=1 Tax=Xanthomonas oryzae pv. oryzae (strain PXO99A) TaxID=360094 RepID=A0A0K0GQI8_XANOP|nr:hypothetical protein PXO_05768 [Xanthomonas oryzae pv. oryzae PXO99A]